MKLIIVLLVLAAIGFSQEERLNRGKAKTVSRAAIDPDEGGGGGGGPSTPDIMDAFFTISWQDQGSGSADNQNVTVSVLKTELYYGGAILSGVQFIPQGSTQGISTFTFSNISSNTLSHTFTNVPDQQTVSIRIKATYSNRSPNYAYTMTKSVTIPNRTITVAPGTVDHLVYHYNSLGQLDKVIDQVANSASASDFDSYGASSQYSYDANGNTTKDLNRGISNIEYNDLNQPKKLTFTNGKIVEYRYNADGLRIEKKINGTITSRYIRNGSGAAIAELNGSNKFKWKAIQGAAGEIIGREIFNSSGSKLYDYYYQKDHLGNIRATVRKNGSSYYTVSASDYYPFGKTIPGRSKLNSPATAENTKHKYQGKERDHESNGNGNDGYDYFEHRYYDASIGRFLQVDAYAEKYDKITPYAAMGNNPMFYTDPTGDSLNFDALTDIQKALIDKEAEKQGFMFDKESGRYVKNLLAGISAKNSQPQSTGSLFLGGWLGNLNELGYSKIMFNFSSEKSREKSGAEMMTEDGKEITFKFGETKGEYFKSKFVHETTHGIQFLNGFGFFRKTGDTWKAYSSQENEIVAYSHSYAMTGYPPILGWATMHNNERERLVKDMYDYFPPTIRRNIKHGLSQKTIVRSPRFFGVVFPAKK